MEIKQSDQKQRPYIISMYQFEKVYKRIKNVPVGWILNTLSTASSLFPIF